MNIKVILIEIAIWQFTKRVTMENQSGKKSKAVKKIISTLTPSGPRKKQIKKELEVSEEKYKAAFEYTGTGMMVLEEDMTISLINKKMCEMTGYSREEVEGKRKWTELVSEKDLERMMGYHLKRREQPEAAPTQYEFQYRHRSGTLHDALITVSMIPGSKKSLVSMIDISDRKAVEKDLIESEKRFKETADLLPSIICEIDRNMKVTYVNKIGFETFGYTQDEFNKGIKLNDVMHKDDIERGINNATLNMSGENISAQEYRLVNKDGTVRDYYISSSRMVKESEVVGIRSCVIDISEIKQMEKQLRESEERLRSIYAASPIGIAVFNTEGSVIDMNASFKHMSGLPEDVDYAQVDFSLFDHIAEMKNSKSKLIKNGGMNFESRNDFKFAKSKDAYEFIPTEKRFLNWHITPLGVTAGTASLFLAQVQDITERKLSEEAKLKEARKVAAEANRVVEGLRKEIYQSAQFQNMVSRSPAMQEIFNILPEISQTSTTVLITGETGTGKELIAKSIHELSPRKSKPFIAINCGALPDNLLESELFGYKAGAFTDAKKDKPGKFALADGGTIFLDEIGDISPAMQVRLLRVLQDRIVEPLGSVESIKVDVRIVAATNKELAQLVREGRFRDDLYYRIRVVQLKIPDLRQRREDIPLLVDHLVAKFTSLQGKDIAGVSDEVMARLMEYDYPGNVRELENIIEQAFVLCRGGLIELHHLPPELRPFGTIGIGQIQPTSLKVMGKHLIAETLRRYHGNRGKAARELGIDASTLYRKIKALKLDVPEYDGRSRRR